MLKEFLGLTKGTHPPFIEQVEDVDKVHIIRLKGPIDMSTIPKIYELKLKAKNKRGTLKKSILLDFKKVSHVDSATIALLLNVLHEVKHEHHKLGLIGISRELREMFTIARVSTLFAVYETEEEAIANVSGK